MFLMFIHWHSVTPSSNGAHASSDLVVPPGCNSISVSHPIKLQSPDQAHHQVHLTEGTRRRETEIQNVKSEGEKDLEILRSSHMEIIKRKKADHDRSVSEYTKILKSIQDELKNQKKEREREQRESRERERQREEKYSAEREGNGRIM